MARIKRYSPSHGMGWGDLNVLTEEALVEMPFNVQKNVIMCAKSLAGQVLRMSEESALQALIMASLFITEKIKEIERFEFERIVVENGVFDLFFHGKMPPLRLTRSGAMYSVSMIMNHRSPSERINMLFVLMVAGSGPATIRKALMMQKGVDAYTASADHIDLVVRAIDYARKEWAARGERGI